jgi:hypothetical protein
MLLNYRAIHRERIAVMGGYMRTSSLVVCPVVCLVFVAAGAVNANQSSTQPPASAGPTSKTASPPRLTGQATMVFPSVPAPVDPTALSLIQKALAALNGGAAITDVTLTGNATRTAGSDVETGPITMKALGARFSRVDISSEKGTRTELRGADSSGKPQNLSIDPSGTSTAVAGHNTMTDAVWFFPALSTLSKNPANYPNLAISYVGQEQKDGVAVQHIHFITELPHPSVGPASRLPAPDLSRLTAMDLYLDASTSLPVALTFATHPDKNSLIDVPVEVEFSSYQSVHGVLVPFHIRKYVNGTLFLDATLQSASINTGLSAAQFAAQ